MTLALVIGVALRWLALHALLVITYTTWCVATPEANYHSPPSPEEYLVVEHLEYSRQERDDQARGGSRSPAPAGEARRHRLDERARSDGAVVAPRVGRVRARRETRGGQARHHSENPRHMHRFASFRLVSESALCFCKTPPWVVSALCSVQRACSRAG